MVACISFNCSAQARRMLCEEAGHFGNVQYVGYCAQHWAKKVSKVFSEEISSSERVIITKKPSGGQPIRCLGGSHR